MAGMASHDPWPRARWGCIVGQDGKRGKRGRHRISTEDRRSTTDPVVRTWSSYWGSMVGRWVWGPGVEDPAQSTGSEMVSDSDRLWVRGCNVFSVAFPVSSFPLPTLL